MSYLTRKILTRKSFKEDLCMKEHFLHIGKLTRNGLREYLSMKEYNLLKK